MPQSASLLQYVVFCTVGLFYCCALLFLGGATAGFTTPGLAVLLIAVILFAVASAISLFRARSGAAIGSLCAIALAIWSVGMIPIVGAVTISHGAMLVLPSFVALGTGIYGIRTNGSESKLRQWMRLAFAVLPVSLVAAYLSWLLPRLTLAAA